MILRNKLQSTVPLLTFQHTFELKIFLELGMVRSIRSQQSSFVTVLTDHVPSKRTPMTFAT